ncbi:MAG TPA: NADH-quinone oxidoreductase subunit M [Anaerolineaceae bacterium]|nr:NADH-quinone oxidoreductase subunit M [Anaerolineaceae bacterium]
MENNLLFYILILPTIAALLIFVLPLKSNNSIRWFAFGSSLVPLLLSIILWFQFDKDSIGFQFETQIPWFSAIGSSFHFGLDGISMPMVLLTTLLTPLAILASYNIKDNVRAYMALFLFLETGVLGVFISLDLLVFFLFWEIGLIPMYFLISQWGGAKRNYAALKFILVTIGGSLGLLLSIQIVGLLTGSFDLKEIYQVWPTLTEENFQRVIPLGLSLSSVKAIAFWAFVLAFAIKVPVWPVHTWLPDAHTEAPTAGSMILAGVLLKLGAYGFIRFVIPLFPVESHRYAGALAILATAAIIFGALSAFAQKDLKRLVAYSSINHMGFVVLGIAAAAYAWQSTDMGVVESGTIALNGAILQMFNHGLTSAGMFFLVGVIYDRTHTRQIDELGGLWPVLPRYGAIFVFTAMAALGLPGLNGFISEFLVVRGAWGIFPLATAISMIGLFFTGVYILKAIAGVLHGPRNDRWISIPEINTREIWVIAPLMILMLWIGIWPASILNLINQAVNFFF